MRGSRRRRGRRKSGRRDKKMRRSWRKGRKKSKSMERRWSRRKRKPVYNCMTMRATCSYWPLANPTPEMMQTQ